jgi:hypothetical protein
MTEQERQQIHDLLLKGAGYKAIGVVAVAWLLAMLGRRSEQTDAKAEQDKL